MSNVELTGPEYFDQSLLTILANVSGGIVASRGSPPEFLLSYIIVRTSLFVIYRLPTNPRNEIKLLTISFLAWIIGKSITYNHNWDNVDDEFMVEQQGKSMKSYAGRMAFSVFISALRRLI